MTKVYETYEQRMKLLKRIFRNERIRWGFKRHWIATFLLLFNVFVGTWMVFETGSWKQLSFIIAFLVLTYIICTVGTEYFGTLSWTVRSFPISNKHSDLLLFALPSEDLVDIQKYTQYHSYGAITIGAVGYLIGQASSCGAPGQTEQIELDQSIG